MVMSSLAAVPSNVPETGMPSGTVLSAVTAVTVTHAGKPNVSASWYEPGPVPVLPTLIEYVTLIDLSGLTVTEPTTLLATSMFGLPNGTQASSVSTGWLSTATETLFQAPLPDASQSRSLAGESRSSLTRTSIVHVKVPRAAIVPVYRLVFGAEPVQPRVDDAPLTVGLPTTVKAAGKAKASVTLMFSAIYESLVAVTV